MALKTKPRSLDAICAKLKQINNDTELTQTASNGHEDNNGGLLDHSRKENNNNVDVIRSIPNGKHIGQEQTEEPNSFNYSDAQSESSFVSSSSRRKRKLATPRNINQVRDFIDKIDDINEKDELAEYTLNNQNTTFPPENESDEVESFENESDFSSCDRNNISNDSGVAVECTYGNLGEKSIDVAAAMAAASALRNTKRIHSTPSPSPANNRKHSRKPSNPKSSLANLPLDLTISKSVNNVDLKNSNDDSYIAENEIETAEDLSVSAENLSKTADPCNDAAENSSKTAENHSKHVEPTTKTTNQDVTVLKDYAESTMNELLSIYGFSGNSDTLTKQVPVQSFTSKQLLQTSMAHGKDIAKFLSVVSQKNGISNFNMADKKGIYANFVNAGQKVKDEGLQPSLVTSNSSLPQDLVTNGKPILTIPSSPLSANSVKQGIAEYSKYLKRFSNGQECKVKYCKELGYREHYHCMDCNFRVFVKKEEMVRHYKWHRKREESLQHGFMRYSPLDDCSQKFNSCTHNGRQTHYHCLQDGCDKVYISTSDVQMHANYHRKDSAIIQEGFQRFRATEDCGTPTCSFYGQRTTHFHCRRSACNFTFKNKADMEKHKTYHQKDEVLSKDGFKKFMKYEHCGYLGCRYSKVSNHIHCIRSACNYVLHSTAQLYSHKRKHERREFETAYQKYRDGSQDMESSSMGDNSMNYSGAFSDDLSLDSASGGFPPSQIVKESMMLPVKIKREAPDNAEMVDTKRFKFDNMGDDSMSDQMSFKSESESFHDESSIAEDNSSVTDKGSSVVEEYGARISGEQLNSSLTLPIPSIAQDSPNVTKLKDKMPFSVPLPQNKQPVYMTTSIAPQHLLPPMSAKNQLSDKREKDESWKSYLIRYTANDPCNSRCQYLYKDHYHCKVEGCLVLFKSKDGVREHARFHELQDRITPVAYNTYEQLEMCPEGCEYNLKEKHYHCIWTGCSHVVPNSGPTFGRLEHYRIHEYARASAGKTYRNSSSKTDDGSPKRRGRPPKYPKNDIPIIPKVELSQEEIEESTKSVEVDNYGIPQVLNGFKIFKQGEICPDEYCIYRFQQHYHCARPRCHQATDRMDVLNLHAKDFHSFVNIIEGFEFFDRNVNCRRSHCHNNKANRHFHCVRPKCDYSFVRHSTMIQHEKKHQASESGAIIQAVPSSDPPSSQPMAATVAKTLAQNSTIKTSGTFYPLSGLSRTEGIQMSPVITVQTVASSSTVGSGLTTSNTISPVAVSSISLSAVPIMSTGVVGTQSAVKLQSPTVTSTMAQLPAAPLAVLLQQKGNKILPQLSWPLLRNHMHFLSQQNCGRPFCKLKKRDHYHCIDCNQAFSDPSRLRAHIGRHGIKLAKPDGISQGLVNIAPKPENMNWNALPIKKEPSNVEENNLEDADSSLNLNPNTFSNMIAKAQKAQNDVTDINENSNDDEEGRLVISEAENSYDMDDSSHDQTMDEAQDLSKWSGRKRVATKNLDFVDTSVTVTKTKKTSSSPKRLKDDSIPDGYIRIKFKDDCGYPKCAYRSGITHFHCSREDCGYSFSDRSRLIQHTLRHERIDSLTGGEMQQYRMNQDCHRQNCEYQGKASHFHCLKCDYSCTDSSKVLTHRKNHAKMESINSQGFHKYGISDDCGFFACQYSGKQSHYHCLKSGCNYGVLGPAQMASHKLKHANETF